MVSFFFLIDRRYRDVFVFHPKNDEEVSKVSLVVMELNVLAVDYVGW